MNSKTVSKIATALMVLFLVLSGTMVQWSARAESHVGTVEGIVEAQGGGISPAGMTVKLLDAADKSIDYTTTQSGGYFSFSDVDVGHYKLIVPTQNHSQENVFLKKETSVFEVREDESVYRSLKMETENLTRTVDGTVTDKKGNFISGTTVELLDTSRFYSAEGYIKNTTTGEYSIDTFNGTLLLRADAPDYKPYVEEIDTSSNVTRNITLKSSATTPVVNGYMWEWEGSGIERDMEVTLYNTSNDRIMHTSTSGPYFELGAVMGDYVLVVDPAGYLPYVEEIKVEEVNEELGRLWVNDSSEERITYNTEFIDQDTLNVTKKRVMQPDTRIQGMNYSYLGNLKMQIDLAMGNGDLQLNYSEFQDFKYNWSEYAESKILSTQDFIDIDGTSYKYDNTVQWDLNAPNLNSEGDSVSVLDTDNGMVATSEVEYTSYEDIGSEDSYLLNMTVNYDHVVGTLRNYTYNLTLPAGYERVPSTDEYIPPSIDIEGYTDDITVSPHSGGGSATLMLDVKESESGSANLTIDGENLYQKRNDTYIIKENSNATCIANFTDPVGSEEEANYTWKLDGDTIGYGQEIEHKFKGAGKKPLKLIIEETSKETTEDNATILVDGVGPTGKIDIGNTTVDEGESVRMSAVNVTDYISGSEVIEGGIRNYEWNFSDGSEHMEGRDLINATHIYDLYGDYTVKLNVTDRVGNWNIIEMDLTVEDTTDPIPKFTVTIGDEKIEDANLTGKSIEKGEEVIFNASASYDPAGYEDGRGNVSVDWTIEQENFNTTEKKFNYTFTQQGTYSITLNVTDDSNNSYEITRDLEVTPGPTPNLEVLNLTISEDEIKVGKKVTVVANVTNYGSAPAENIVVVLKVDGEEISTDKKFMKNDEETNATIDEGEYKLIEMEWKPDEKGDRTLTVNITDGNEPASAQWNNEMNKTVNVNPPIWREYIVYIIAVAAIVGVTGALYYYRKRFQGE